MNIKLIHKSGNKEAEGNLGFEDSKFWYLKALLLTEYGNIKYKPMGQKFSKRVWRIVEDKGE